MSARLLRFGLVGAAATLVHVVAGLALLGAGAAPLLANAGGFAAAVSASLLGHHRWTFHGHGAPLRRTAPRFLAVALGGFALGEAMLAASLGRAPAAVALPAATLTAAAVTFLLARKWAFATPPPRTARPEP